MYTKKLYYQKRQKMWSALLFSCWSGCYSLGKGSNRYFMFHEFWSNSYACCYLIILQIHITFQRMQINMFCFFDITSIFNSVSINGTFNKNNHGKVSFCNIAGGGKKPRSVHPDRYNAIPTYSLWTVVHMASISFWLKFRTAVLPFHHNCDVSRSMQSWDDFCILDSWRQQQLDQEEKLLPTILKPVAF